MQLPPPDPAPPRAPGSPVLSVYDATVHDTPAVRVARQVAAPLSVLLRLVMLLLAIPVSCLPELWRTRTDPDSRLPLTAGTFLSSLLLYGGAISFFGRALYTGQGWLIEHLPPSLFALLCMISLFEPGMRIVHVLALRAPIGTVFLWSIERTIHLAHLAHRAWRRSRGYADDSALPRARVVE